MEPADNDFRVGRYNGFFPGWIRLAIFAAGVSGGALIKDLVADHEQPYTGIGFQLDLQFTLVHRLPKTLSSGYVAGFSKVTKLDDEIIFSLKIL